MEHGTRKDGTEGLCVRGIDIRVADRKPVGVCRDKADRIVLDGRQDARKDRTGIVLVGHLVDLVHHRLEHIGVKLDRILELILREGREVLGREGVEAE